MLSLESTPRILEDISGTLNACARWLNVDWKRSDDSPALDIPNFLPVSSGHAYESFRFLRLQVDLESSAVHIGHAGMEITADIAMRCPVSLPRPHHRAAYIKSLQEMQYMRHSSKPIYCTSALVWQIHYLKKCFRYKRRHICYSDDNE